jgi:heme/copper-type cytochrome/quinol oxidase subunit 1
MEPGVQYMTIDGQPNGHLWNVLITGHGVLMMFFCCNSRIIWWIWQLFYASYDRRTRYGISKNE